jgi:hypothetical protein
MDKRGRGKEVADEEGAHFPLPSLFLPYFACQRTVWLWFKGRSVKREISSLPRGLSRVLARLHAPCCDGHKISTSICAFAPVLPLQCIFLYFSKMQVRGKGCRQAKA